MNILFWWIHIFNYFIWFKYIITFIFFIACVLLNFFLPFDYYFLIVSKKKKNHKEKWHIAYQNYCKFYKNNHINYFYIKISIPYN